MDRFQGFVNLDGVADILLSLTSIRKSAFHSIINVGNKVICGLQTPKIFVNFHKYNYPYFTSLNIFFWKKKVYGFNQTVKGDCGTKI
jgi:hypothetical protein